MRKMILIYCLAIAAILYFIYKINVYLALGIDTYAINLFPRKELPHEFDDYKNLSEINDLGNYAISLFAKDEKDYLTRYVQIIEISKENTILKAITKTERFDNGGGNSGNNFSNTVFKFDSFGNILDTINYKTSSSNQSEFGNTVLLNKQIVNKELLYYQTWPTDGDKVKKDFIPLNKDFSWNTEEISKYYYNTIVPNSAYLEHFSAWRDSTIHYTKRQSVLFLLDNKWYILYGVSNEITDDIRKRSVDDDKKIKYENLFTDIPSENIVFKYFHKLEYCSNMAGKTQSNSPYTYYYWNGNAYLDIIFNGETLKVKQEDISLDDYDTKEPSIYDKIEDKRIKMETDAKKKYSFYTHTNLKFAFISDDEHNLYLIKNKK